MIVRVLIFLMLATPLMAVDYDTLFFGNIEDAKIKWTSDTLLENYPVSKRNHGGLGDLELFETSTSKSRVLYRFSAAGLAQVPDTNAITSARLYIKTSLFSTPYQVKIYALYDDKNWDVGTNGGSQFSYGHGGVSWYSPDQPDYPDTATGTLPTRFDWRDSNLVTTVKNQGICWSCQSFGLAAQIESAHKKDVIDWTIVENSEDGTGADRNVDPLLTPNPEVTATGWEQRNLPAWLMDRWYRTTGTDNGLIFIPDSGDIVINTSENASNKPRIFLDCVTRDKTTGNYSENITIQITGADLFDSYINSASPTTNYGTATTAPINSTNRYVMRVDSLRRVVDAALSGANDTLVTVTAAYCSLYVSTKNSNAAVRAHKILKSKFIEDSVTYNLYRGTLEWGAAGANKVDQLDLSEQQAISCVDPFDCTNGGDMDDFVNYFLAESLMTEDAFRYQASSSVACLDTFGTAYSTIIKWIWRIPAQTERAYKQAIMIQPLAVNHWLTDGFDNYSYATNNTCWFGDSDSSGILHVLEVIGWNDNDTCDLDGGVGTWLVKNQYGSDWGQDGFAYVSRNGYTDFVEVQHASTQVPSWVLSVTASVPAWDVGGLIGGTDVRGLVATTPTDIAANGWQYIEIPAWVLRGMKNGNIPRTILLQAEDGSGVNGVQFAGVKNTTSADRPYLVLKSVPDSQFNAKIGNAKIGNAGIGR